MSKPKLAVGADFDDVADDAWSGAEDCADVGATWIVEERERVTVVGGAVITGVGTATTSPATAGRDVRVTL